MLIIAIWALIDVINAYLSLIIVASSANLSNTQRKTVQAGESPIIMFGLHCTSGTTGNFNYDDDAREGDDGGQGIHGIFDILSVLRLIAAELTLFCIVLASFDALSYVFCLSLSFEMFFSIFLLVGLGAGVLLVFYFYFCVLFSVYTVSYE